MRTNTERQQATRRMTPAERQRQLWARIDADTAARHAWEAERAAVAAMWEHAHAAGLDAYARHALDMALMNGADPAYLSTTF